MAAFEPSPDLLLAGRLAVRGAPLAHRAAAPRALGVLFLAERFFRRDAAGEWEAVTLSIDATAGRGSRPVIADAGGPPLQPLSEPRDDLPPGGYAAMVRACGGAAEASGSLVSLTSSQCVSAAREPARRSKRSCACARRIRRRPLSSSTTARGECLLGASPDLQLVIERRHGAGAAGVRHGGARRGCGGRSGIAARTDQRGGGCGVAGGVHRCLAQRPGAAVRARFAAAQGSAPSDVAGHRDPRGRPARRTPARRAAMPGTRSPPPPRR